MTKPLLSPDAAAPPLLFCPFCGEGYDDREDCPEHELTLVPFDSLSRSSERELSAVSFFVDPRLGRGAVLLGSALVLVGFLVPFVVAAGLRASALEVAIDGAVNLWFTPVAALTLFWILWLRRSRHAMQAARAAVFGLAVLGSLPLLYTTSRIRVMAEAQASELSWLSGLWLMLSGLLLVAAGARGLGGRVRRRGR